MISRNRSPFPGSGVVAGSSPIVSASDQGKCLRRVMPVVAIEHPSNMAHSLSVRLARGRALRRARQTATRPCERTWTALVARCLRVHGASNRFLDRTDGGHHVHRCGHRKRTWVVSLPQGRVLDLVPFDPGRRPRHETRHQWGSPLKPPKWGHSHLRPADLPRRRYRAPLEALLRPRTRVLGHEAVGTLMEVGTSVTSGPGSWSRTSRVR
jgi:hypothetical protein